MWRRLLGRSAPEVDRTALLVSCIRAQAYSGDIEGALASYEELAGELSRTGPVPASLAMEWPHIAWELSGPAAALDAIRTDVVPADLRERDLLRSTYELHGGDLREFTYLTKPIVAACSGERYSRGGYPLDPGH